MESALDRFRAGATPPPEPLPTGEAPRLRALAGVRASVFDVYGTLLVSGVGELGVGEVAPRAEALREALEAAGLRGGLEEAGRRGAQGLEGVVLREHARRRAQGVEYPEVDIREVWAEVLRALRTAGLLGGEAVDGEAERVALEYEVRVNPAGPMPGAVEMLAALRASGRLLGIVSNAQFYTPLAIEACLGASPAALGFASDLCAWSFEAGCAKPSSALFGRVLQPLATGHGIAPHEVLYVGNDMLKDIRGAHDAGCRTALFAGDARSLRRREDDPRCRGLTPDLVLTALDQLPGCLPDN